MARKRKLALAIYALIGLFTFGRSASHIDDKPQCADVHARDCSVAPEVGAFLGGGLAAVVWPLYWSWELQS